jgi:hypothetical protein
MKVDAHSVNDKKRESKGPGDNVKSHVVVHVTFAQAYES